MWFLLAVAACAPRASVPAAAVVAADAVQLTLDPRDLQFDEAAGVARYTPGSGVQAAAYDAYTFHLATLERALGGRPTAPVTLWVALGPPTISTYTPDDPNMPAPMGGFQITTRAATVVSVEP